MLWAAWQLPARSYPRSMNGPVRGLPSWGPPDLESRGSLGCGHAWVSWRELVSEPLPKLKVMGSWRTGSTPCGCAPRTTAGQGGPRSGHRRSYRGIVEEPAEAARAAAVLGQEGQANSWRTILPLQRTGFGPAHPAPVTAPGLQLNQDTGSLIKNRAYRGVKSYCEELEGVPRMQITPVPGQNVARGIMLRAM